MDEFERWLEIYSKYTDAELFLEYDENVQGPVARRALEWIMNSRGI